MSKHICWRGFKRMCDRCSHSLFHAPDLNNSPCTDNPCTQDHLHGTAEPGNFRLRPSVCFCSITAPSAQGAPLTRLYSAEEESPFSFAHSFSPFPLFKRVSVHVRPSPWRALLGLPGNIFQIQHPSWGAQLQLSSTGTSTSSFHVQESQCPQLVIELCRSTHSGGIICADSCSVRLETLASANTLPSLPTLPPTPLCISPFGDPAHPNGAPTERLNSCALAAACHLVFSQ